MEQESQNFHNKQTEESLTEELGIADRTGNQDNAANASCDETEKLLGQVDLDLDLDLKMGGKENCAENDQTGTNTQTAPLQSSVHSAGQQYDVEEEINALYSCVPEVGNHFTITAKIGEGAFSSVYLAQLKHYPEVHEMFAIKHIIPTTHPSRIENELRCLLKIGGHDNVMGVKLCMRNRDHVVIVMPLFPHDKFQEYLHLMDLEEARDYMKNLLVALRRVHQFGVIHRDIKPSNFLYNRQQKQFALVDFGLASGAFLIDRDGEKRGLLPPTKSITLPTDSASQAPAKTGADDRSPLSPSKKEAGERNSANISKSGKSGNGKGTAQTSVMPPPTSRRSLSACVASTSRTAKWRDSSKGGCDCFGKPMICTLCVARSNQVAPRAGTAGFRSPEVLLKSPEQTTAVDVWAAGVIFLSILSARYPFFRAQDDMGYLAQIISVLGSEKCIRAGMEIGKVLTLSEVVPSMDLKSACMKLRSSQMSLRLLQNNQYSTVLQSWANISDVPFDLLSKMLDPNPQTRISAEEALNHPFFTARESDKS